MKINEIFDLSKYDEAFEFVSQNEGTTIQDLGSGQYQIIELPKPSLEELKEAKRAEINQAREEARKTEGAEYDGDIFDVDEVSQSNILAQIKVAELLKSTEATYTYRSKTNKDHLLTVAELQQLGLMIAQKVNEIYARSWKLKALVDEATTPEEVEAITWDMKDEEEQAPENI